MERFDFFGNKKNIRKNERGNISLSENQIKEYEEIGIIERDKKNNIYLKDSEGNSHNIEISDKDLSIEFQYHIPRELWGKSLNIISMKYEDKGRIKIIYIPDKDRIEIWENFKGEKRKMILRKEGKNKEKEIIEKWNSLYPDYSISIKDIKKGYEDRKIG